MFYSYNNNDDFLNLSINEPVFPAEENPFNLNIPDNLPLQEGNPYSLNNSPLPSIHQGQLPQMPENQENSVQEDEKNNISSEINDRLNIFEEEPNFKIGESFYILEGNKENLPILDEKNDIQKQNEKKVFNINSTVFTSKESGQNNPEKIVSCQKRIDYGQKYFKTKFSKFLKNLGNNIIQNSGLPAQFQNYKLALPNHISFTGNSKEKDNYNFLSFTVQQIFGYYKNENCKNSLQKKNKTIIEEILAFVDKNGNEKYESIRSFFSMDLERAYELYYESKDFKEYASEPKAIELDKEFIAQKKDSLLEKFGYIKMCKKFNKKAFKQ